MDSWLRKGSRDDLQSVDLKKCNCVCQSPGAYLLPAAAPCNCSVHSHFPLRSCRRHAPGTPRLPAAGRPRRCNTPGSDLAGLARGSDETAPFPPTGSVSGVYWEQEWEELTSHLVGSDLSRCAAFVLERLLLFCKTPLRFVPDVAEQEGGLGGVLNSTKWQQDGVGHLQGIAGNGGTEGHAEAAVLALKFNVVFILTLAAAIRQERT